MAKSKNIPIKAGKDFLEKYEKDQVIILTWHKESNTTTVTTYGKTKKDCDQAALGGNVIKKGLGWGNENSRDGTSKVKEVMDNAANWEKLMANLDADEIKAIQKIIKE